MSQSRPKPINKNLFASWTRTGSLYVQAASLVNMMDLEDTKGVEIPVVSIKGLKLTEPKVYVGLEERKHSKHESQ